MRETKGKIVTYEGKAAQAFYFSSSGGRTASALDVYGSDVPYLVSVDDPWDDRLAEPPLGAAAALTGRELAKALRARGGGRGRLVRPRDPGRAGACCI